MSRSAESSWTEPAGAGAGARVRHASFGVGVIDAVDDGDDPTATVRFTGWGSKRIKLRFLKALD